MNEIIQNFFNLDIYAQVLPFMLEGLWTTLWLSALVIPLGGAAGLALALAVTQSQNRLVRWTIVAYVDFFRAFPPLVLLILVYFGGPFLGVELNKVTAVALAFVLNNSSYFAEVFRAGLEGVHAGPMEAARSRGGSGGWGVGGANPTRGIAPRRGAAGGQERPARPGRQRDRDRQADEYRKRCRDPGIVARRA